MPIPILLDGDPGHDDAIAWMLACSSPKLRILCVTSSAGNQSIEKTTCNALRVMALLGLRAPMAKGSPKPLVASPRHAPAVHGESGLDGPTLPEPIQQPVALPATELMAQSILVSPHPVTIVSTGPLTNTAALLLAHPEVKSNIARICLMGGGITHGNWSPAAEFNILCDPEGADLVFRSGIPITMAGLDVTERALLFPRDFDRIRAVGGTVAPVVADWLEYFYRFHREKGYSGAPIHDAVAVAWLLAPQLFTARELYVTVETGGQYCRGATIADLYRQSGEAPNATVLVDVDRKRFADLLVNAVAHWAFPETEG